MMEILRDVTIVIPSFNRQKKLIGRLEALKEFPGKVIAVDGTKNPIDPQEIKRFPENVTYLHSSTGMGPRFRLAKNYIKTKYVFNLGDDDILLMTSLANLVEIIQNENIEIVTGHALTTYRIGNSWEFNLYNPDYYPMKGYEITNQNEQQRIESHISKYICTSFYALLKKETWVKIYCSGIDFNSEMKSAFLSEIGWEILAAQAGNIRVTDHLLWLRLNDGPAAWESTKIIKKRLLTVSEMLENSQEGDELDDFIQTMQRILKENSDDSYDAEFLVKKCLSIFSKLEINKIQSKPNPMNKFIKYRDKVYIKMRIISYQILFLLKIKNNDEILQQNLNKIIKKLPQFEVEFNKNDLVSASKQLLNR
jgi:glycosyltransferase domain-containing protein